MSAPFALDRAAVDALAWTLIHFVWQGALLGVVFAVAQRALARARANTRYLVGCGTMLLMLLVPVAQFAALRGAAPSPRPAISSTRFAPAQVTRGAQVSDLRTAPAQLSFARDRKPLIRLYAIFPWVVTLWSAGVLLLSVRLLGGWWLVRRLRRTGSNAAIPEWQPRMIALARRLGVSRPVRLFRSAMVQVPTAMGWLQPVILVPASTLTGLSPRQIESILAHELAHIRRHDYLVNLLQSLVETLLFYHPVVWWVSRRVREERELCCDDLAVAIAGDPVIYADALCRLERLRGEASLALAATGGSLLSRIARLLGTPPRGDDHGSRGLAAVLGTALVLTLTALPSAQSTNRSHGAAAASPHRALARATSTITRTSVKAVKATAKALAAAESMTLNAGELFDLSPAPPAEPADPAEPAPAAEPAELAPPAEPAPIDMAMNEAYGGKGSRSYYTVDEWIQLSQHGVKPETVEQFRKAGLAALPASDLVKLVDNGVSPDYVGRMGRRGLGAEDLVRLAQHGVTPEFVSGLRDLGAGDLPVEDLVRLADHGVTPEWYAAMRWMGYPNLTVEKAIRLRDQGVSAEFASQLKVISRKRFSLDELVDMQNHGLTSEWVARMENALGGLESRQLIRLYDQGVAPDYVAKMQLVGRYGVDDLVALSQQDVSPEYAFQMASAGYRNLAARDLIRLRQNGVTLEFVGEARDAGHAKASIDEICRLSQSGLSTCDKNKKKGKDEE